jgi:hypothetical protein
MSLTPLHILSARLQSDTPVCGVALEPYILVRRGDGTTVSAGTFVDREKLRASLLRPLALLYKY